MPPLPRNDIKLVLADINSIVGRLITIMVIMHGLRTRNEQKE